MGDTPPAPAPSIEYQPPEDTLMSQLKDAPEGRVIGTWTGRHNPYALAIPTNGKRLVWCRFGTLGWERLGELVDTPEGPALRRAWSWERHPLPDVESEIVERAARASASPPQAPPTPTIRP